MESIAKKVEPCPEEIIKGDREVFRGAIEFFEALEEWVKGAVTMVIERAINEEFRASIGCLPYERTPERKDVHTSLLIPPIPQPIYLC